MLKIIKQAVIAAVLIAAATAPSNAFALFEPSPAPGRPDSATPHNSIGPSRRLTSGCWRSGAQAHPEGSPVRSPNPTVPRVMLRFPHRAASSGTTPGSAPQECSGSSEPWAPAPSSHAAGASTRPPPSDTTTAQPLVTAVPCPDRGTIRAGRPPSGRPSDAANLSSGGCPFTCVGGVLGFSWVAVSEVDLERQQRDRRGCGFRARSSRRSYPERAPMRIGCTGPEAAACAKSCRHAGTETTSASAGPPAVVGCGRVPTTVGECGSPARRQAARARHIRSITITEPVLVANSAIDRGCPPARLLKQETEGRR